MSKFSDTERLKDAGKALVEYAKAVESYQWLKNNGELSPDADVEELAYSSAIKYASEDAKAFFTLVKGVETTRKYHLARE